MLDRYPHITITNTTSVTAAMIADAFHRPQRHGTTHSAAITKPGAVHRNHAEYRRHSRPSTMPYATPAFASCWIVLSSAVRNDCASWINTGISTTSTSPSYGLYGSSKTSVA